MMNAFDVLLHPSQTEGFGLLSIEAQSCGFTVIVSRNTSMPELVIEGQTGWICEVDRPWWRNLMGYVWPANVDSLYNKMEEVYKELQNPKRKEEIAKDCRDNIVNNYNIDTLVAKDWTNMLQSLQEEILGKSE